MPCGGAISQAIVTTEMAAFARRKEIGIMPGGRLHAYISLPFLMETLVAAVIGIAPRVP